MKPIGRLIDELDPVLTEDECKLVKRAEPPRRRQAPAPTAAAPIGAKVEPTLSQLIDSAWCSSRFGRMPVVVEADVITRLRADERAEQARRSAELARIAALPVPPPESPDDKVARITAEMSPHVKAARAEQRQFERETRKQKRKENVR